MAGNRFSRTEEEYLKENWFQKTDDEIAAILGRSNRAIKEKRKLLGLEKGPGRPAQDGIKKAIMKNPTEANLSGVDKSDRINFFKNNFDRNPRYSRLKKELSDDDLEFYKHKYVEFIDSVETMTIQEEDMLHHMIMSDIHISTIRQQIKSCQDAETKDSPFPMGLYQELKNAEDRLINYHKNLRVTREQRLNKDKEEKVTITSLIKVFQERRAREEFGKQAGVMQFNMEQAKKDMDKFRFLLGDV